MISNNVDEIYTIEEVIELGKENTLNLENTNILTINQNSGIVYPYQNILREHYRPCILRYCREINLNDAAIEYYKFNPKKMSMDLYGGTELWHLILWLNNMVSVTEFNKKRLIVFNPSSLAVLNTIIENESENLYRNRQSVKQV